MAGVISVNGEVLNILTNEVSLESEDELIWWSGYSHYIAGTWLSMCESSAFRSEATFCRQFRDL